MAEVTMQLPNKQTLLYTKPGVEVSAKQSPPSMTYVDPSTQVTMKNVRVFGTYLEDNPVELEAPIARETTNDVELTGNISRTVTTDAPIRMELTAQLERAIAADVEITAPLVRNVTSYQVDLEYSTRRDVINSAELEVGLKRHVESRIELECPTVRIVLNDEDGEIGVPSKEYGSFVDPNKLYRVQHDVLNEDVSDNPYFEKQISNLKNAALLTRNQTVIKAINELFVSQREAFLSTFTALEKMNATIGDIVLDKELRAKYAKMGAENVIDGLIKLSVNIDTIVDFIGSQSDQLEGYNELGYANLVDGLRKINEKIKTIDFDWDDLTENDLAWMFRMTDYIPDIKDQVFTLLDQMQDEIDAFKNGLTRQFFEYKSETEETLARQYQTLIEKMNSPYDSVTEREIREMFKTLGQEEIPVEDEDVYFQMFKSLAELLNTSNEKFENDIDEIKQNLNELNQDIQGWADIAAREVRNLFDNGSDEDDYNDIYLKMYATLREMQDAQKNQFEHDIATLREDLDNAILQSEWASITVKEIEGLFNQRDPDVEPDEDVYAGLFKALSDRIEDQRERLDQHIREASENVEEYNDIRDEEIRRIFAILQEDGESEEVFEARITSIINIWSGKVLDQEEAINEFRRILDQFKAENTDITEEEVRKIFAILSGEDTEETFESRVADIINSLKDRVIAQEEETVRLRQEVENLRGQVNDFSRSLDLLSRQIAAKFENFTSDVNQRIRSILSALETAQNEGDGTVTYEALVAYLESERLDVKTRLEELDNRVTGLETQLESVFTEDDVCSTDDIVAMFPGMTGDENAGYAVFIEASEDQIRGMFQNVHIGGDDSDVDFTVKDILDLIVTEEGVMDIFRSYLPEGIEVNTMEELLEALANRNNS